jgi:arginine utilization regulatory protein
MNDNRLVGLINAIVKNIKQGVVVLDNNNHIIEINEKALKILSIESSGVDKIDIRTLFKEDINEYNSKKTVTLVDGRKIKIRIVCRLGIDYKYKILYLEKTTEMVKKDILESIVNSIDEAIMACDYEGYMTLYNDSAEMLEGLSKEEVIGRNVKEVYNHTEETSLMIQAIKQKKPFMDTYQTYTTMGGKRLNIVCNTYPLFQDDEVIGAVSVMRDHSKMKELLSEIVDLREIINKKKNKVVVRNPVKSTRYSFDSIVGVSDKISRLINYSKKAAENDSAVLIYGETGTGKELFSQSIHNSSRRKNGPFVAINCAAIPENLLEGILFGTVKGAFSGAIERPGLFEQANEGTLLLDELNSMPLGLQAKLLRVLQEGSVRRVGAIEEKYVDVRLISNINIRPYEAIKEKKLRQDLFYRLSGVSIEIPALRERKEDLPILMSMFIKKFNKQLNMNITGISSEVMDIFYSYDWPGNIRELQHAIESAINIMSDDESIILTRHLPFHIINQYTTQTTQDDKESNIRETNNLTDTMNLIEKQLIINALRENVGNVTHTAKQLGLHRRGLQYRLTKYNIEREDN